MWVDTPPASVRTAALALRRVLNGAEAPLRPQPPGSRINVTMEVIETAIR